MGSPVHDDTQYENMNKNRPDTNPNKFRMQDGGLYSVNTVYTTPSRNLGQSIVVGDEVLSGHQMRMHLQQSKPGSYSMNNRD